MDSAPTSYHEAHEGGSRRDSGDGSFITLMRTEGQGLQDNISAQDDDIKELRVPDVSGIPPRLHEPSIYRRLWRFTKGCWVELVACVLALASLLAIMATTYAHQDLPFPKWSYGLSINTLVAIYIAVMKAALVLVASQGECVQYFLYSSYRFFPANGSATKQASVSSSGRGSVIPAHFLTWRFTMRRPAEYGARWHLCGLYVLGELLIIVRQVC